MKHLPLYKLAGYSTGWMSVNSETEYGHKKKTCTTHILGWLLEKNEVVRNPSILNPYLIMNIFSSYQFIIIVNFVNTHTAPNIVMAM